MGWLYIKIRHEYSDKEIDTYLLQTSCSDSRKTTVSLLLYVQQKQNLKQVKNLKEEAVPEAPKMKVTLVSIDDSGAGGAFQAITGCLDSCYVCLSWHTTLISPYPIFAH